MADEPAVLSDEPDDQPSITLEVDGEVFSLRPGRQPRSHVYAWLSGPNDGYGFSSRDSSGSAPSLEEHRESIRDFLAMVDPQTGYIEDGPADPVP